MATIGYHASHEQFAPRELLECVRAAEAAGFGAAMCSDHFYPWSEDQGQSGNAWAWLGAALEATGLSFGTVTVPGYRYHPAVLAQAIATLAAMYPGRLWVACGSGEALNEHITGKRWPRKKKRNERLEAAVRVMRDLLAGREVDHDGNGITVERARLYTLPQEPPMLIGAALTPKTAEWVGSWADGLVTVGQPREKLEEIVRAFRRGGGDGKPMYLQAQVSYAASDAAALTAAHEQWRFSALQPEQLAELETPEEFDEATEDILPADLRDAVRVSSDLALHARWIEQDLDMGFERVYVHNVGRNQQEFIEAFGKEVLPRFEGAQV